MSRSDLPFPVSAVILAGGRATRMGGDDKGWVPLAGKPLIVHVLERLRPQVDEVLINANRSEDRYRQLASVIGDEQADFQGPLAGMQAGLAAARHDWVLCLDADERVSPALRAAIESALTQPAHGAYRFARCNRFLGRYLKHGEGYPDWSLRLFDRRQAGWSDDAVHEKVVATGSIGRLAGDLLHDSAESLATYLNKQNRYTSLAADMALAAGKRASFSRLALSPIVRFIKFYVVRQGFRDGLPGLIHIAIGCMNSFLKYAKMLERQNTDAALR